MTAPDPAEPLVALTSEAAASRRVPWAVVGAASLFGGLAVLLWFGHQLSQGSGSAFDRAVMLWIRAPAPAWLPSAVRDVTALGSTIVLTLVVAAAALFLVLRRRLPSAALVVTSTLLGAWTVSLIKAAVGRARPDLIGRMMEETSHSFPSGHAANSAIVYLTLAVLLFPVVPERRMRAFLLGTALLLTGLIGISRIYLGVHWPSDVVAGWAFGAGWALLWWRIELRLIAPMT